MFFFHLSFTMTQWKRQRFNEHIFKAKILYSSLNVFISWFLDFGTPGIPYHSVSLACYPPAANLPQILLDASSIQLGDLPLGVYTPSPSQAALGHTIYEVCVCPSGKVYLSPAESSSTCQTMSNICLWSWPGRPPVSAPTEAPSAPDAPRATWTVNSGSVGGQFHEPCVWDSVFIFLLRHYCWLWVFMKPEKKNVTTVKKKLGCRRDIQAQICQLRSLLMSFKINISSLVPLFGLLSYGFVSG